MEITEEKIKHRLANTAISRLETLDFFMCFILFFVKFAVDVPKRHHCFLGKHTTLLIAIILCLPGKVNLPYMVFYWDFFAISYNLDHMFCGFLLQILKIYLRFRKSEQSHGLPANYPEALVFYLHTRSVSLLPRRFHKTGGKINHQSIPAPISPSASHSQPSSPVPQARSQNPPAQPQSKQAFKVHKVSRTARFPGVCAAEGSFSKAFPAK